MCSSPAYERYEIIEKGADPHLNKPIVAEYRNLRGFRIGVERVGFGI